MQWYTHVLCSCTYICAKYKGCVWKNYHVPITTNICCLNTFAIYTHFTKWISQPHFIGQTIKSLLWLMQPNKLCVQLNVETRFSLVCSIIKHCKWQMSIYYASMSIMGGDNILIIGCMKYVMWRMNSTKMDYFSLEKFSEYYHSSYSFSFIRQSNLVIH